MNKPPNILFLMNDHQLYYRHGWDSGVPVQRPHFDKLAAEGIEFKRAYTVCPLCTPARRSILTSLFPHAHGQLQNRPERPFHHQTYLTQLAKAGYDNYYFGKWHAGDGTAADFGCQGYSLPGYGNPYTSAKYKTYLHQRGLQPPTIIVERDFAHENRLPCGTRYQQTDEQGCWEHMSGIMDAPDDTHEAFFLANLACEQLEEIAKDGGKRPFSFRVDFWSPHQPYFPTPHFANMYNPANIPIYGNFYDDLETKPSIYQRELNYPIGDQNGKLIQPSPLPWPEWQQILARCYAQITLVDAAGGRILNMLDELGLAENTLVIWTADHGDGLACHGGHFNKGCYLPEELLRIPLAIRYPPSIKPQQTSDALVSNLDFAPTILDFAGTAFDNEVHGRSLRPLLEIDFHKTDAVFGDCVSLDAQCRSLNREKTNWRTNLMCETNGHDDNTIGRALITQRYKYIATKNDLHELYDLEKDPYELTNLISTRTHTATRTQMQQKLHSWQTTTQDPESKLFQKQDSDNKYDAD